MSLTFNSLTDETAARLAELRRAEPSEFSEYSLSYLLHWQSEHYRSEFAETAGCGVLRFNLMGRRFYSPPFGPGNHNRAWREIREQESGPIMIGLLTEAEAGAFSGRGWLVRENGWGPDYVYSRRDLAELKGSRYQAKRNFCTRFERNGSWRYGPLNPADALKVLESWRREKEPDLDDEAEVECRALEADLPSAKIGGILYQDNRPVAFAVGERLSDQTLLVAYEKALSSVVGAYQTINREFARREGAPYLWLNRASADGHPGLVKAKESYHPARRLRKFLAIAPSLPECRATLRRKTDEDMSDIVTLWQDCFGDDASFIRSVAENNPGFVIRDERGLAAMAFVLPREGSHYVYGVATRADCRRKGYATALLDVIWLDACPGRLALVPGDPALVPFYERRGFSVASCDGYLTMTRPAAPGYRVPQPMND